MLYHKPDSEETKLSAHAAALRREYAQQTLDVADVHKSPLQQFEKWFDEAVRAAVPEPNAMHLSTVGHDGRPSGRIVLLKDVTFLGFQFFTNYESRKGEALAHHPFAALTFFWPELERQVRIEGRVERLSAEASYAYFRTRPVESQIGAWASPQSRPLPDRKSLEARFAACREQFAGEKEIPLPPHWGGYHLAADYYEFWQGRHSRLHDRIVYTPEGNGWRLQRLAP